MAGGSTGTLPFSNTSVSNVAPSELGSNFAGSQENSSPMHPDSVAMQALYENANSPQAPVNESPYPTMPTLEGNHISRGFQDIMNSIEVHTPMKPVEVRAPMKPVEIFNSSLLSRQEQMNQARHDISSMQREAPAAHLGSHTPEAPVEEISSERVAEQVSAAQREKELLQMIQRLTMKNRQKAQQSAPGRKQSLSIQTNQIVSSRDGSFFTLVGTMYTTAVQQSKTMHQLNQQRRAQRAAHRNQGNGLEGGMDNNSVSMVEQLAEREPDPVELGSAAE